MCAESCAQVSYRKLCKLVCDHVLLLLPATKLRQGNDFTPVCDSVPSMHHRSHDKGGLYLRGGLCPEGSLSRGSLSIGGICPEGVSVQGVSVQGVSVQRGSLYRGLCPGGLCPGGLCPGGLCPGGLCPEGVSVQGALSKRSLSRGSLSRGSLSRGTPHMVTNRQYASYWNALLLNSAISAKSGSLINH